VEDVSDEDSDECPLPGVLLSHVLGVGMILSTFGMLLQFLLFVLNLLARFSCASPAALLSRWILGS
jgi:hypothetical protein